MELTSIKYTIELKHQFSISYSSRKTTPAVLIKIDDGKHTGFGEASLPPYLKETQDSVLEFLSKIKLREIISAKDLNELDDEINSLALNNYAAKAAVNIALNDLLGKKLGASVHGLYGIGNNNFEKHTSYTIGIDEETVLRKKINEAADHKILKIKLGTENDKKIIKIIRDETDKPLFVDANQGWKDRVFALEMIEYLCEQNVIIVEQPMPVYKYNDSMWLKEKSSLPIIADEAFQSFDDISKIKDSYHGINIKLMKCGGINKALKIIKEAQKLNLKIMLGCMTETSCAVSAAAQLSHFADYLDLDGNLLISNDPFESSCCKNGIIKLSDKYGLGISEKKVIFGL